MGTINNLPAVFRPPAANHATLSLVLLLLFQAIHSETLVLLEGSINDQLYLLLRDIPTHGITISGTGILRHRHQDPGHTTRPTDDPTPNLPYSLMHPSLPQTPQTTGAPKLHGLLSIRSEQKQRREMCVRSPRSRSHSRLSERFRSRGLIREESGEVKGQRSCADVQQL